MTTLLEVLTWCVVAVLGGVALFYGICWLLLYGADLWVSHQSERQRRAAFMESHSAWGCDGQIACESCFKPPKDGRFYHQLVGMFSNGEPDYAVVCRKCWGRE